jgi:hypothetical protein
MGSLIEGHLGSGERLQVTPKPAELRMVNTRPDAPGINEPPSRIVIRQQERPEPRTGTVGIGPPDNHELHSVLALDLDP